MMRLPFRLPRRGLMAAASASVALLLSAPLSAQAPPNDSCASPLVIPASSFPYTSPLIDTRAALDESSNPVFTCLARFSTSNPPNGVTKTIWFSFTPASTDTYTIDTLGSTAGSGSAPYDSILGVYTGFCGNFVSVACNDNTSGSPVSRIDSVALNAGTTYTIVVGGVGSVDNLHPSVILANPGGIVVLHVDHVAFVYPYTYLIPSVARTRPAAPGVPFTSDLFITNLENTDANYLIQFMNHGSFGDTTQPSSQPSTANRILPANGSSEFLDVLSGVFGLTSGLDFGGLLVRSTTRLFVGAKTYSPGAPSGTYGQYTAAVDLTPSAVGGDTPLQPLETGKANAIRGSGSLNVSGDRTNFVLYNNSNAPCTAHVEVRDQNGNLYAGNNPRDLVVPPNTVAQANNVKLFFGISSDLSAASLVVKNQTTGCKLTGAAYTIDNLTQDPFTVPVRK